MKKVINFSWTTNTAGAATVYGDEAVPGIGEVVAVDYLPGTTDTGATFTLTSEGAFSTSILAKTTAGTANVRFYPRIVVNGNTDGAALTGTAGGDRARPLAIGQLKVVIASGGAVKTGTARVYVDC